jgi:hypothetical protein
VYGFFHLLIDRNRRESWKVPTKKKSSRKLPLSFLLCFSFSSTYTKYVGIVFGIRLHTVFVHHKNAWSWQPCCFLVLDLDECDDTFYSRSTLLKQKSITGFNGTTPSWKQSTLIGNLQAELNQPSFRLRLLANIWIKVYDYTIVYLHKPYLFLRREVTVVASGTTWRCV